MLLKSKKKEFMVEDQPKTYTPYIHFFESVMSVNDLKQNLSFKCLFCPVSKSCRLGATSNLLAHLKLHKKESEDLASWLNSFKEEYTASNKIFLDAKLFTLL